MFDRGPVMAIGPIGQGVRIQVDFDGLTRIAREIDADVARYRDAYTSLYSTYDEMIRHWAGKDNLAFTQKLNGFRPVLVRTEQSILEYVALLHRSAAHYRETKETVVGLANKLPVPSPGLQQ